MALGITCAQCTPVQLELLRRAGAMPVTSRRCGMITRREAERLCKSFLGIHTSNVILLKHFKNLNLKIGDHSPPKLPENFAFDVSHCCACEYFLFKCSLNEFKIEMSIRGVSWSIPSFTLQFITCKMHQMFLLLPLLLS